jgi:DNA replication protein DnaC
VTDTAPTTRTGKCLVCQEPIEQTFNVLWLPKYCSDACSDKAEADGRQRSQFFAEAAVAHHRRDMLAEANVRPDVSEGRLTLDRLPDLYDETRIVGGVERMRYREIVKLVTDFITLPPLLRASNGLSILYLYGENGVDKNKGTGKTWLLEAAVGHVIREMEQPAVFTTPIKMWTEITATYQDQREETTAHMLDRLIGCYFLAMDDLGRKTTPTRWELEMMLQVADERYRLSRPTAYTSNYNVSELHDLWSDRDDPKKSSTVKLLCDRLADSKALHVPMNGKSLRRGK